MVEIIINNNYSYVNGELSPYIFDLLNNKLSFVKMGHEHTPAFLEGKWDGSVRLFDRNKKFLTGLISPVCETLLENKIEYKIIDRRLKTENNFPEIQFINFENLEKRDYQGVTVQKSLKKTRGIWCIGTGGGKTLISAELIGSLKVKPFMFYVLTKDLLYQTKSVFSKHLNCEIGQIGDGIVDIKDVNVCTKDAVIYCLNKNNKSFDLKNYKFDSADIWDESNLFAQSDVDKVVEVVKDCRGMIIDEAHHASSATIKDLVLASEKAYWRFGCTATYAREDGEEMVIQGLFGKRIVDISLSYLIENNFLVPAGIFFVPVSFKDMPYKSYPQIYNHCVIENEEVAKNVSDNANYLASLGKTNLILVSKITHGKIIKKYLKDADFLTGKDSSKKRNKIIDNVRNGKQKILIATTLADEGLDIKNLDVVHIVGAGASVSRVPQRIGRVVRKSPGKKYGIVVYYHYCTDYLYKHGLKAKKIVREEPELKIIQVNDLSDLRPKIIKFINENDSLFSIV